jgi:hypothetical protein
MMPVEEPSTASERKSLVSFVDRPRLQNLLNENMAIIDQGRFKLTSKGRTIARVFILARRIYGLGLGG